MNISEADMVNLRALRDAAGLSQTDLGKLLDLTQSQISRYESVPDEVPYKIVMAWKAACGDVVARQGLRMRNPYETVTRNITFLKQYIHRVSEPDISGIEAVQPPTADSLLQQLAFLNRKPRIALYGKFDAGKSRLGNTLLGIESLPTGYTPTTRLPCVISHVDEKPDFIKENVWIMDGAFSLNESQEEKAYWDHRLTSGSFDTLKLFGAHHSDAPTEARAAGLALIYLEAPLLQACQLIDLPGYGNDEHDTRRAEILQYAPDAVLFVAPSVGFLNAQDLANLAGVIDKLPVLDNYSGMRPLSNLFIIASHANPTISDSDLDNILNSGARRLFDVVEGRLSQREGSGPLSCEQLRARFFPFYVEAPERRASLEQDLRLFLQDLYPAAIETECDDAVRNFKLASHSFCTTWAGMLDSTVKAKESAQAIISEMESRRPEVDKLALKKRKEVTDKIQELSELTRTQIASLEAEYDEKRIEAVIRAKYKDDRRSAQAYGPSFIVSSIDTAAAGIMAKNSDDFIAAVDDYLSIFFGSAVSKNELVSGFNPRVAFLESIALTGGADVGALRIWVQRARDGLVVEVLSPAALRVISAVAAGVSATAVAGGVGLLGSFLAAPLIMGAIVVVSLLVAAASLFSGQWQERLARKVAFAIKEKKVLLDIGERSNQYWTLTLHSFKRAADAIQQRYAEYLRSLESVVAKSPESVADLSAKLYDARSYFDNLPWVATGSPATEGYAKVHLRSDRTS